MRATGRLLPNADSTPVGWTSAGKFAAVVETAAMNEAALMEYSRQRGLYPGQVRSRRPTAAAHTNSLLLLWPSSVMQFWKG